MRKNYAILFMMFAFAIILSGYHFIDNKDDGNEVLISVQNDDGNTDVELDLNMEPADSTSAEQQTTLEADPILQPVTAPKKETSTTIQYYTPTIDGTGLEFDFPSLENCLDDSQLHSQINYGFNRLLYGIGVYAGCYEVNDNFMAPEFMDCTSDIFYEGYIRLTFSFVVRTVDEKTLNLTADAEFECDLSGCYGGQPIANNFMVEILNYPYCYDTFDIKDFYERVPGSMDAERRFNIDSGTVVEILKVGEASSSPSDKITTTTPSVNALSDSALEYEALSYINQIATELKNEYRNNGYRMFMASPHAAFISITERSDDTVTIQGTINYWFEVGGDPDGELIVTLLMDQYSGDVIMHSIS